MIAHAIGVVVQLYLGRVLAENLNVDLVPRVVLRRACIGKEGGYNTVVLDRLHRGFIVTVMIVICGTIFRTGIIILSGIIAINRQRESTVFECGISLPPYTVEARSV